MLNKIILVLCLCGISFAHNSPVFIWGSSSTPFIPALTTLTSDEFADILAPNLDDSMVLVFLENNLQTRDFSQCKLPSGQTCFLNLKTYQTKTFYANVEDPIEAAKSLGSKDNIESVKINNDGKLSHDITFQAGKIVLITFDKSNDDRSSVLINHDAIMAKLYSDLKNGGKVVAFYTSQKNNQVPNRIRRQAKAEPKLFSELIDKTGVMVYAQKITIGNEEITLSGMTLAKQEKNIIATLASSKGDIKLTIVQGNGYWYVTEIAMGDDKITSGIEAMNGFSYYCGDVSYSTPKGSLVVKNLQIEVKNNVNEKPTKFGDSWHCVGFISGGIISGLFVTFMFIIIMAMGITWLMDIRTMDRFDDPKGKTITINASD